MSAKYVALSGVKNLIYLLWIAARVLFLSKEGTQVPEEIDQVLVQLTERIMHVKSKTSKAFNFRRTDLDLLLLNSFKNN